MGFGWIFESLDFWHRKAMTRRSDPPVVLVKWYDFTKWVLGHVDNFPKNQRFVFGQRLADGVITILELIVDAECVNDFETAVVS
jgi:hypothetical protein